MSITVDPEKFESAHHLFEQEMLDKSNGTPFTNFQHPVLLQTEIDYKRQVSQRAKEALSLDQWGEWIKEEGKIIQAAQKACKVSKNLLDHKYGLKKSSEYSLYKVEKPEEIKGLESQLANFFLEGSSLPSEFGVRFDAMANYLRTNRLSCSWPFLSYLAFVLDSHTYFPVRSSYLNELLKYYGIEKTISGHVSWERYCILLDVAEDLKSKLSNYGSPDAVEIHSYMWVIAYRLKKMKPPKESAETEPTGESAETEPTGASAEQEPTGESAETEPTGESSETEPTIASSETEPTIESSEKEPTIAKSETT